jgi:hypothetical protein
MPNALAQLQRASCSPNTNLLHTCLAENPLQSQVSLLLSPDQQRLNKVTEVQRR